MPRDAVLDGAASSGVFGEVAPDEAGLEAHGVARVEQPELLDRLADLAGHNAGLHDGHHVFPVDLQDPVHPLEGKHDAPAEGHGAAGKPRPAPAGGYGDTVPVGDFHDFRDLAGRGGSDDNLGHAGVFRARNLELPKMEQECREAWFSSLSSACTRRNQITKRLYEELNPELARLRAEMPSLGEERKKVEDALSVLKMNLQSHQNYLAQTARPTDERIAEQDRQCQLMELSMGLDSKASTSTVTLPHRRRREWSGMRSLSGPCSPPKIPGPSMVMCGASTARSSAATRPAENEYPERRRQYRPGRGLAVDGQAVGQDRRSLRGHPGKARVQQTVSITGPASVLIQDQPKTVIFEARIIPRAQ